MKKKRLRLVTTIAILAALFGSGGGTAWGQAYKNRYVTSNGRVELRRASQPGVIKQIDNAGDANNEFGAGESVTIKRNGSNEIIAWPATNNVVLASPITDIQLGSDKSKNIVVHSYGGNGYGIGWVSVARTITNGCGTNHNAGDAAPIDRSRLVAANNGPRGFEKFEPRYFQAWQSTGVGGSNYSGNYTGTIENRNAPGAAFGGTLGSPIIYSFNYFNMYSFTIKDANGNCQNPWNALTGRAPYFGWDGCSFSASSGNIAPCGYALFDMKINSGPSANGSVNFAVAHHYGVLATLDANAIGPGSVYTTSIERTIDHVPEPTFPNLKYPVGVDDGVNLLQFNGSSLHDAAALQAQYTTHPPKESGSTLAPLDNYKRPTTVAIEGSGNVVSNIFFEGIEWWYKKNTVRAQYDNSISYGTQTCCSGTMNAYGFSVAWAEEVKKGQNHLDAAVELLKSARVCVNGDVLDKTGNITNTPEITTGANAQTDAVIVVPYYNRFTMRTKGNFQANMVHLNRDSVDTRNVLYGQAHFPIANNDNILLKSTAGDFQDFAGRPNMFVYPNYTVPFHNYNAVTATKKPYNRTEGAVFGIYGDYLFVNKMADIHTDTTTTYNNHNMGVIEVGPRTANKSHFHVYGNGMLKNYESCNGPAANFAMQFGDQRGTIHYGGTPVFKINTDDTLYVVNFGNNGTNLCAAKLQFHTTSVDSIAEAFSGTGKGALQIQALNNVEFNADGTWNNTTNGNNIYVLSDAGNIVSQKLTINSDNSGTDPGHGLINFMTAGKTDIGGACTPPGTRNKDNGNIYLNDEFKIERAQTASTQTNFIARNNIRTAKFTSTHLNEDTTNIISRDGDIYLGYSAGSSVYNSSDAYGASSTTGDANDFKYDANASTKDGQLNIMAGWDDSHPAMTHTEGMEGGNVYFTRIITDLKATQKHNTTIAIPYSSEYICDVREDLYKRSGESMVKYEHSGIIGGLGRCGEETTAGWTKYAGALDNPGTLAALNSMAVNDRSLKYKGNEGNLIVDAGKRGNIILNKGAQIEFQDKTGNATFRTRAGDIDMRDVFDAEKMKGSLLFLAQLENFSKLSEIGVCGCDEMRNNVYLQDFEYKATGNSGSVFIGADNNIKLNYGGLTNIGTRQDPFLSTDYKEDPLTHAPLKVGRGYKGKDNGCGTNYHCDLNGDENKARLLLLNFSGTVTSGGFAAVASDMIDVYTDLKYKGGNGSGLSTVPETGTLHGENVAGYGLFMKTQGNKHNWTDNILLQAPKCPTTCSPTGCGTPGRPATGFLHNTVRMTFHSDARFYAENQHVHLESPVIETFGVLELNAEDNAGAKAMITIKTDSLICHDSLIRKGKGKVQLTTWSGLPKDQPIIKLGYSRKAAPFMEYAYDDGGTQKICRECVSHYKGKVYPPGETPLDTMFVKFGPDTEWERQNVMVVDHTVISFLTDSFDHVKGGDVLNARYFVDTTKIRNQVEFWTDPKHERDGHLELISEEQMGSKDYAGLYTRHLHLEPIGACGRPTSELWLPGLALDVITTSTFGGFGIQYTDVHVENGANLNPGFTSLRLRGQCYEQACGTLTMKDLRLDGGSELHFSVGTTKGLNGEYSDAIDVDRLTTYGPVNVNIEIRPCDTIEKRCYPIMYYKSVTPNSLNNLKLNPRKVKIDGEEYPLSLNVSTDGIVYVCVGDAVTPGLTHTVTMPETAGVKTTPSKGIYPLPTRTSFRFSATYSGAKPLVVRTNRKVNGQQEVLNGVKNANGEYEYIVPSVQQEVTLTFGPDVVANELLTAGTAVWSHGEKIYIRVERADIASIYSVAGQLVKRVDLPEGDTSIPMSRGAYVITLKDGSVHKVIVK